MIHASFFLLFIARGLLFTELHSVAPSKTARFDKYLFHRESIYQGPLGYVPSNF